MATSGSYDWSLTANGIINEVLEDLQVIIPGGTPATAITTSALAVLNRVTKALSTKGIRVWSIDWVQKTFSAPSEVVGTDGENYSCILGHTSAAANRPISGANYTTYWIKTGTSGGVWATPTAYTSSGDFDADVQTLNVLQAFIREGTDDSPLYVGSMDDYFKISDKTIDGKPTALYFNKLLTGHIYLYPQPHFSNYADYVLHYLRESKLEDFDAVGNDPDFNSIYIDYLVKELRYALAPKYSRGDALSFYKADRDEAFRNLKKKESEKQSNSGMSPSFNLGSGYTRHRTPEGTSGNVSIDSP